ncbi:HNH endonuclease [Burkholderia ubonensis]|uniref:HNH endonuclease n=1 Tax=Burkholderia ubonensis TaxID=101571 RepID=UPI0009B3F074|nr:HNH endonuclease [Burkholderia ubonensis]
MAQTPEGALKIAAKKAGMDLATFIAKSEKEKRCTSCKQWKDRALFNRDRTRHDGLSAKCLGCSRVKAEDRVVTKGRQSPMRGKQFSAEARARMGRPKGFASPMKGVPRSSETKAKISAIVRARAPRGPAAPRYIDGKSAERQNGRASAEAKRWRYDVMSRDGWMCIHCGDDKGGNLEAHHRKEWAEYPELRFDVSNGITLCRACHWLAHAYHGCVPGLN